LMLKVFQPPEVREHLEELLTMPEKKAARKSLPAFRALVVELNTTFTKAIRVQRAQAGDESGKKKKMTGQSTTEADDVGVKKGRRDSTTRGGEITLLQRAGGRRSPATSAASLDTKASSASLGLDSRSPRRSVGTAIKRDT